MACVNCDEFGICQHQCDLDNQMTVNELQALRANLATAVEVATAAPAEQPATASEDD